MTALTFVAAGVVIFGLVSRRGYGRALSLGGATPAGAALLVGGVAVPTFYAVALGALVFVVLRAAREAQDARPGGIRADHRPVPANGLLLLFVVACVLITLVSPMFFHGL